MSVQEHNLSADIGAEFVLQLEHQDASSVTYDYSSGFIMRFVIMTAFGGTDIFDETSPNADFVLSDGAGGTANISVNIGKTLTEAWTAGRGRYELQIWPSAATEDVKIIIKGVMTICQGLL